MYEKEIEAFKKTVDHLKLKTHVGARKCVNDKDCPKHNKIQITHHYICPYCSWGMETIEGYNPCK